MGHPQEFRTEPSVSPEPAIEVSYVLASCNGWHYLDACLKSLSTAGAGSYEVIVIDNASTDGTPALLGERYPQARVWVNKANVGHCRAVNQGIRQARGEYLAVLDGDTVVEPGATVRLIEFLRASPDAAIAAPRMLNPDGTVQETARSFPALWNGLFGRQSVLTRMFPNNPFARNYLRKDAFHSASPFAVDWVSAAFMIFHRSLPERIGLLDEGYLGYWVDADWCKAAHAAGKVYCVPASRVIHFEQNRTGKKKGRSRILLFHSGAYRFYRKHETLGPLDPRAVLGGLALGIRCTLLICADWFQRADEPKSGVSATPSQESDGRQPGPSLDVHFQRGKK
jgi:GT2 family glycosyltransferase